MESAEAARIGARLGAHAHGVEDLPDLRADLLTGLAAAGAATAAAGASGASSPRFSRSVLPRYSVG